MPSGLGFYHIILLAEFRICWENYECVFILSSRLATEPLPSAGRIIPPIDQKKTSAVSWQMAECLYLCPPLLPSPEVSLKASAFPECTSPFLAQLLVESGRCEMSAFYRSLLYFDLKMTCHLI